MIQDCELLAVDYEWTLTRKNACHIANQNQEMAELRDAQQNFSARLDKIEIYVYANTWIWGVIAVSIIGMIIKKIFSK